jgi:hypothetical protein
MPRAALAALVGGTSAASAQQAAEWQIPSSRLTVSGIERHAPRT